MPLKIMVSKDDKILIGDDDRLIEIEVLMVGQNRAQLEIAAATDIKIHHEAAIHDPASAPLSRSNNCTTKNLRGNHT